MASNQRAITRFTRALAAPEDLFQIGTSFRSNGGDVLVKIEDDVWAHLTLNDEGSVAMEQIGITGVVGLVRDSGHDWEVTHNWKTVESS